MKHHPCKCCPLNTRCREGSKIWTSMCWTDTIKGIDYQQRKQLESDWVNKSRRRKLLILQGAVGRVSWLSAALVLWNYRREIWCGEQQFQRQSHQSPWLFLPSIPIELLWVPWQNLLAGRRRTRYEIREPRERHHLKNNKSALGTRSDTKNRAQIVLALNKLRTREPNIPEMLKLASRIIADPPW